LIHFYKRVEQVGVDKKLVDMPPPRSSPAQVGIGTDADVKSIRRSWAQETSPNFASDQEFPPMTSNTKPPSNNNSQHIYVARTQSPSSLPTTPSLNILNNSCPSYLTASRSSGPQSPMKKTPSASLPLSNKLRLNRSCRSSMTGTQQTRSYLVQQLRTHAQKGTKSKESKEELNSAHLKKAPPVKSVIPQCLVSIQQALASTECCPVMTKKKLTQAWGNKNADLDTLMERLHTKMEAIRQCQEKGLVHFKQSQIEWDSFLSGQNKVSSKTGRRIIEENRKGKWFIDDISPETENKDEQTLGIQLGRGDSDNEDWYRKTSDDTTMNEVVTSQSDSNLNMFSSISNIVTSNVLNILQSNGIVVTPVKEDKVTTEENKDSDVSVEIEEMGTCPLCDQVMLIGVLPQHASDCQGPEVC